MKHIKTFEGFGKFLGNKLKNLISGAEESLYRNELEPLLDKLSNDFKEHVAEYRVALEELFGSVDTKFNHNDDEYSLNPFMLVKNRNQMRNNVIDLTKKLREEVKGALDEVDLEKLDTYIVHIEELYEEQKEKDDERLDNLE